MNEYTDVKKRTHKVIQTIRKSGVSHGVKESCEMTEKEIVEALFRIFFADMPSAGTSGA